MTSSELCTACGLCCDGTLFSSAPFGPGDDMVAFRELGVVSSDGQSSSFPLPCRRLDGTCCTIYPARPAVCGNFRCRVLRRFDRGEITDAQALSLVARAQRGRDRTRAAFAELIPVEALPSIDQLALAAPTESALKADPALARRWGSALAQLVWLKDLIQTEFRTRPSRRSDQQSGSGVQLPSAE